MLSREDVPGVKVRTSAGDVVDVGDVKAARAVSCDIPVVDGGWYEVSCATEGDKLGPYSFPAPSATFAVLCCDASWQLPVRDTWRDLARNEQAATVFHIGDQVYHDLTFSRMMNFLRTLPPSEYASFRADARRRLYGTYLDSWLSPHKRHTLATRHNVMIGDDHEVTDDAWMALPNQGRPEFEFLKEVAVEVYREVQGGLRADRESASDDFYSFLDGDVLFLMVGRMYNMVHDVGEYVTFVSEQVERKGGEARHVILLMARPPANRDRLLPFLSRPAQHDFTPFYDMLFHVRDVLGKKVTLVGGDLHVLHEWDVSMLGREELPPLRMTVVPAMASVVPSLRVPINLGVSRSTFRATRRRRSRVNGFCLMHKGDGSVRHVTRRYWWYYGWNEAFTGAKDLWSRLTRQRLVREEVQDESGAV